MELVLLVIFMTVFTLAIVAIKNKPPDSTLSG